MSSIGKGKIELVLKQRVIVGIPSKNICYVHYEYFTDEGSSFWNYEPTTSEEWLYNLRLANRIIFLLRLCNRVGKA